MTMPKSTALPSKRGWTVKLSVRVSGSQVMNTFWAGCRMSWSLDVKKQQAAWSAIGWNAATASAPATAGRSRRRRTRGMAPSFCERKYEHIDREGLAILRERPRRRGLRGKMRVAPADEEPAPPALLRPEVGEQPREVGPHPQRLQGG